MGYQTLCLGATKWYVKDFLFHSHFGTKEQKPKFLEVKIQGFALNCLHEHVLKKINYILLSWIKAAKTFDTLQPVLLWKNVNLSQGVWCAFWKIKWGGGPLIKLFSNPFAHPIFAPEDNHFSPRQDIHKQGQRSTAPPLFKCIK